MKHVLALLLISSSLAVASIGTPVELRFPAGSGDLYSVAMNDKYIAAGIGHEVQVFNAITGALVRRIKGQGILGKHVAVSGGRVFSVDAFNGIKSFDIATGKEFWTFYPGLSDGPIIPKDTFVEALAADDNTVIAGMYRTWLFDSPIDGFFVAQGSVSSVRVAGGPPGLSRSAMFGEKDAHFGWSVAVAGYVEIAGEPNRDVSGITDAGRVNVYVGGSINLTINNPSPIAGDNFGESVGISGSRFLVGAPMVDLPGRVNAGRVYFYDRSWLSQIKALDAPASLSPQANFGEAIAVSGSMAVIGGTGHAWLYDIAADVITQLPPMASPTVEYGRKVAICSHSALVADTFQTGGTASRGRVYLFKGYSRQFPAVSILASAKKAAPGTASGTTFVSVGQTALSSAAKIMHQGTVSGGGTTSATNTGMWNNLSGSNDLILREGDTVGTAKISSAFQPFFTPGGQGIFSAKYTGTQRRVLFRDTGAALFPMLAEGSVVEIDGDSQTIGKLHDAVSTSKSGEHSIIAFSTQVGANGVTAGTDSRIGRIGIAGVNEDAREGQITPIAGTTFGQISPRVTCDDLTVSFTTSLIGALTSANTAIVAKNINGGSMLAIAQKGQGAPGIGANYSTFTAVQTQGSEVVYKATLTGGVASTGQNTGIWRKGNTLIAHRLRQAPGTGSGVKFVRFLEFFNAGNSVTLFRAQVSGPGITSANDIGIWVHTPTVTFLYLIEGMVIPGTAGLKVGTIQRFDADKTSTVAVLVSLVGAPSASNQALLASYVNPGSPTLTVPGIVVRKGSKVDRPGASTSTTITSISLGSNQVDSTGAGSRGAARQTNAFGILFTAKYATGSDLVFLRP
jgi:hypothetical protein